MPIVDELVAILGYELKGKEKLDEFNDSLDNTEEKAKAAANRAKMWGAAAAAAVTTGVAVTGAAVKNFATFERSMTRIGITADATALETAKAADDIQRLAKQFALPIEDAVAGLDTLVASGMALDDAMEFLPSVLATAQAAGASTVDIANTAQKAASALKLESGELQRAFDIMVQGGKAGQFELKDMSRFIPELANSFASLGYTGEDGLKRLVAVLQTIREDTGSASAAATQAQNIFGKMYTEETAKKFEKLGVDLRSEMEAAKAAGEDALSAFVRISTEVLDGDLSKLPLLFTDQEFRLGMQSLITSQESLEKFLATVNSAEVDGTVFRDLKRVLEDTQAQIDRTSSSWDRFLKSLGAAAADPVGGVLDYVSNNLDAGEAARRQLKKEGLGYWERENWFFRNTFDREAIARKAREGGYVPAGDNVARMDAEQVPYAYQVLGRRPQRPSTPTPDNSGGPSAWDRFWWGAAAEPGFSMRDHMRINAGISRPSKSDGTDQLTGKLAEIDAKITAINSSISSAGATEAVVNDNSVRTDARDQSVNVGSPNVTVNVQSATDAPAAAGAAVGKAVGQAAVAPTARLNTEPSF